MVKTLVEFTMTEMSVYIFVVPLFKGSFLLAASGQSPDPYGTRGPVAEGNTNNYLHSISKRVQNGIIVPLSFW